MKHRKNKKEPIEEIEHISMKELDRMLNDIYLSDDTAQELGLIKRYLERLMLIIERSRIREYMTLTDSKRRLFVINFVAGLGKGFGQAIGFTMLAAVVFYMLSFWIKLPIIGAFIAKLLDIVENYRKR